MAHLTTPSTTNPYIAFDPSELRNKIIDRLNQGQVFTDQNYQGSNISAVIDIIGYVFGTLQYYNSKVSSESMFSEAQVYENMNRIVKLINYKPIGRLAQNVPFQLSVSSLLGASTYIIPRFSSIVAGNITFSLTSDLVFTKNTNNFEDIVDINNNYLLHQGTIEEYPTYNAIGIENEVVFLALNESIHIDHFNIFVYVKSSYGQWKQYNKVEDRSTYTSLDEVYEIRFNSNKRYEITFGDGINGKQLVPGDSVAIYYLNIDPNAANIGSGALNSQPLRAFNSIQYQEILKDTSNVFGRYLTTNEFNLLSLKNMFPSSNYTPEENIDSIRLNAPKIFRSQHRLVSLVDYDYFIKSNFKNLITSSSVVNNDVYLRGHLKYLSDIGLSSPQSETRVLFNQIKFASSCNFNNVYVYSVPVRDQLYMSSPQKEYIINEIDKIKTLTTQIVFMDPEYMIFDFCIKNKDGSVKKEDVSLCNLRIYKDSSNRRSNSAILFDVAAALRHTFDKNNLILGQDINTNQMSTDILSIEGVKSIETYRKDTNTSVGEISFAVWNSKYPDSDCKVYTQSVHLDYFQFAVFNNLENLSQRIEIIDASNSIKIPEF
jgi:hypothetical protein